jgi:CheY-like chemotaxis protein
MSRERIRLSRLSLRRLDGSEHPRVTDEQWPPGAAACRAEAPEGDKPPSTLPRPPSADDITPAPVADLADELNRLLSTLQVDAVTLERSARDPDRAESLARTILATSEELAALSQQVLRQLPAAPAAPATPAAPAERAGPHEQNGPHGPHEQNGPHGPHGPHEQNGPAGSADPAAGSAASSLAMVDASGASPEGHATSTEAHATSTEAHATFTETCADSADASASTAAQPPAAESSSAGDIDLNALVDRTAETLHRVLDGDVTVAPRLHAEPLPVRADPRQIRQALFRLAVAARESLAPGATLQIETQSLSLTPQQALDRGPLAAGEHAAVRFLYTASASPHTAPERLRGPDGRPRTSRFVRGLADAQRIASEAGGHLQVAVTPGSPSWLTLALPLTAPPEDDTHRALRESWPPQPASLVLVVDGDPEERAQAALALRSAGYRVLTAESAEEADVLLEDEPQGPKLLLTDVVLPGLPGTELAERLGARFPSLRVLYTSALSRQVIVSCGDLSPDAPFVPKPSRDDRLLPLVRRLIDTPTG